MSDETDNSQNSTESHMSLPEKLANRLLQESIDPILIGDVEDHTLEWGNAAGARMLGIKPEEINGFPLDKMHPPEDLPYVLDCFDRQAHGDDCLAKNIPVVNSSGKITYYDVQSVTVDFRGKKHLMGVFRDITELKDAERLARESEDRFRLAIKSAPIGLHMYSLSEDNSLIFQGGNEAADEILGIDNSALTGMTIEKAFPAIVGTHVPDAYRQVARDDGIWHDEQVLYKDERISGAFEVMAFQIRPAEVGVLFWDISERRKVEEEMSRLMAAINALGESVVITDANGIIEYANPYYEKLTGYTMGELEGKHIRIIKSGAHDDAFYKKLWKVLERGEIWSGNFINKKKDGTVYHESATISPVRNSQGKVMSYVAVKRDMTRELDLERRVMRSQKMAALGQFAHRVAHDVTNSLSTIMGCAEIIGKQTQDESTREMAESVVTAVDNISGLTTSLMGFAHPGAMNTRVGRIDLLVKGMQEMIERACKPNVEVDYDISEKLRVKMDQSQLEQAVMHLVVNATEAIESHGNLHVSVKRGLMPARIAAESDDNDGEVPAAIITLKDTGAGLTKEECDRAFEPFFTTKRDLRRNAGLGLATVYSIVARHNGDITISSEKGRGAELRIALPLSE